MHVAFSIPAPAVSLAASSFDAWMASRSGHFRARMRRGLRKLESRGGTIRCATSKEAGADLAAFVELHHGRWRRRGGSGVLTPSVERMLTDVVREHLADGRVRLWSIDLDGHTVSVQIFLAAGEEVTYWLGGFDDRIDRLHPGPALLSVLKEIEHACSLGQARLSSALIDARFDPASFVFACGGIMFDRLGRLVMSCGEPGYWGLALADPESLEVLAHANSRGDV